MWQTWNTPYRKDDVEGGARALYPTMLESPELRWTFIRKVYSILSLQLLLTIAVASVVVTVHPIAHFFVSTGAGLALYIVLIITPFISTSPFLYKLFFINLILISRGIHSNTVNILLCVQHCAHCITITRNIQSTF